MLDVLGSRKRVCDGVTRRDFLKVGSLGLASAPFADLLRAQAATAAPGALPGFGRAKNCIVLFLYGAASQLETFDLKPDAPTDTRGPFKPIETSVSGVRISEHLPKVARQMHRMTLIRSMTHPFPIHCAAYALTGNPQCDIPMELNPRDQRHWPYIGSVVDYLDTARSGGRPRDIPANVCLPWRISSRSFPHKRAGPYGGFLGSGWDPVYTEFIGEWPKGDPFRGFTPEKSYFQFTPNTQAQPDITLDRLARRKGLLEQFDEQRRRLEGSEALAGYDRVQQTALSLVTSAKMREALDLSREPRDLRERYGMHLFGQGTLAARRMIERGVRFATVVWDEFNQSCISGWDTHVNAVPRLTGELLPGLDSALSTLLTDLADRGLLGETLVLVITEHGRPPKLNAAGGRDHWSDVYCGLMAGGGAKAGVVVGASDHEAGQPVEHPVSPKDVLATAYHLLGIRPETEILDRLQRPLPLVPDGKVDAALIA
jgi:hypothetical protein